MKRQHKGEEKIDSVNEEEQCQLMNIDAECANSCMKTLQMKKNYGLHGYVL